MASFDIQKAKSKLNSSKVPYKGPITSLDVLQDTKNIPTPQTKPFEATKTGIAVNTVKGLPKASFDVGKAIAKFSKDVVQGTARGAAATGT